MIYEIGRELMAAADEMKSEHRDQATTGDENCAFSFEGTTDWMLPHLTDGI